MSFLLKYLYSPENSKINEKIVELEKLINILMDDIELLKKENIKLKKNNEELKKSNSDLYQKWCKQDLINISLKLYLKDQNDFTYLTKCLEDMTIDMLIKQTSKQILATFQDLPESRDKYIKGFMYSQAEFYVKEKPDINFYDYILTKVNNLVKNNFEDNYPKVKSELELFFQKYKFLIN